MKKVRQQRKGYGSINRSITHTHTHTHTYTHTYTHTHPHTHTHACTHKMVHEREIVCVGVGRAACEVSVPETHLHITAQGCELLGQQIYVYPDVLI